MIILNYLHKLNLHGAGSCRIFSEKANYDGSSQGLFIPFNRNFLSVVNYFIKNFGNIKINIV